MLLEGKNAVIYGGGGTIGGAVARAFAREGAKVFLAGRTLEKLEAVAADVREAGGDAEAAVVDGLDERSVDEHAGEIGRGAQLEDVGNVAAFVASDKARTMTAATANTAAAP